MLALRHLRCHLEKVEKALFKVLNEMVIASLHSELFDFSGFTVLIESGKNFSFKSIVMYGMTSFKSDSLFPGLKNILNKVSLLFHRQPSDSSSLLPVSKCRSEAPLFERSS